MTTVALILAASLATAPEVLSRLHQVSPATVEAKTVVRSPGQTRAVVLIHGFTRFPGEKNAEPLLHPWQQATAPLVRSLGREADVFAFAYAQLAGIPETVERCRLCDQIRRLRQLGYTEIVLLGHSAGGLLVRQLVEDHPDLPVTRAIQVAAPNLGTGWATLQWPGAAQNRFLSDLTKWVRQAEQTWRAEVRLPAQIEFVCVVANGFLVGDGIVLASSQWPEDLARQGVPVHELRCHHRGAVRDAEAIALLTNLATTPQRRWTETDVASARRKILGK